MTEFDIEAQYASRFKTHVVGAAMHQELWVPSEQLEEFNQRIVGAIRLVGAYSVEGYVGPEPHRHSMLQGKTASEQLPVLKGVSDYSGFDFWIEIGVQRNVVQLIFAYWVRRDFSLDGLPTVD